MNRRPILPLLYILTIVIFLGAVGRATDSHSAPMRAGATEGELVPILYLPVVRRGGDGLFDAPASPYPISFTLDSSRAQSVALPTTGGTVSATAADGTRFTLTVPATALLADTTITLTPLASVDGLPPGGELVAGVHLAPEGLAFYDWATLVIEPAQPVPVAEQVVMATRGPARELFLHPRKFETRLEQLQAGRVEVLVDHFSAILLGEGTSLVNPLAPPQNLPSEPTARLQQYLGHLFEQARRGEIDEATMWERVEAALREYFHAYLQFRLQQATESCDTAYAVIPTALSYGRTLELIGIGVGGSLDAEAQAVLEATWQAAERCWQEVIVPCIDQENAEQMQEAVIAARQIQLLGGDPTVYNPWSEELECQGCGWVKEVEEWRAHVTFSYAQSASSSDESYQVSHIGDVTMEVATAYTATDHIRWEDTVISGTGEIDDRHVEHYPDEDRVETRVGQGPVVPAGTTVDQPGGSIGYFEYNCMMEFYLKLQLPTTYTDMWGQSEGNSALGFMDVNNIPIPEGRATISGSRDVATVWLIEHVNPAPPDWFSPGTGWVSGIEDIVADGNLLPTKISWQLTPLP